MLLLIAVAVGVWFYWSCYYNITPQLHHILISLNDKPLKVITGEKLLLHPNDSLRILKIATNICFN